MANEQFSATQERQIRVFLSNHAEEAAMRLDGYLKEHFALLTEEVKLTGLSARQKKDRRAERDKRNKEKADKEANTATKDGTKAQKEDNKEKEKGTDLQKSYNKTLDDSQKGLKNWALTFGGTASITRGITKGLEDMQAAMRRGAALDPLDAIRMGINAQDLVDIQSNYRRVALAMPGGVDGFTTALRGMQLELLERTGDMKTAAYLAADIREASQSIGLAFGDDTIKVADNLKDTFFQLQKTTGMAADKFGDLIKNLSEDNDVRYQMFRLNKQERLEQFNALTNMTAYYTQMGYLEDQAVELAKQFSKLTGKSPLERIREAAKIQAFGGSIGMGEDAQTLARLHRKTNRTGDEQLEYEKAREAIANKYMSGLGNEATELFFRTMGDKLGLHEMFAGATRQEVAGLGGTAEAAASQERFTGALGVSSTIFARAVDTFQAAVHSAVGLLAGGALMNLLGARSKAGGFGPMMGGAGNFMKSSPGLSMGGMGKGVGLAGAGFLAGGIVAEIADLVQPEPSQMKDSVKQGIQYALTGAGAGSMFGIPGMMIGGAIGGLLGAAEPHWKDWFNKLHYNEDALTSKKFQNQQKEMSYVDKIRAAQEEIKQSTSQMSILESIRGAKDTRGGLVNVKQLLTKGSGVSEQDTYKAMMDSKYFTDKFDQDAISKIAAGKQDISFKDINKGKLLEMGMAKEREDIQKTKMSQEEMTTTLKEMEKHARKDSDTNLKSFNELRDITNLMKMNANDPNASMFDRFFGNKTPPAIANAQE